MQPIENFGTQVMNVDMTADVSLRLVSDQAVAFLEHEDLQLIHCQAGPSVFISEWDVLLSVVQSLLEIFISRFWKLHLFDRYTF